MSANETCGECGIAFLYEGRPETDPFSEVPEPHRSWLRKNYCVCSLKGEIPLVLPMDKDPADIPCDFWEER